MLVYGNWNSVIRNSAMAPVFCGTWTRGLSVDDVASRYGLDLSKKSTKRWSDILAGWALIGEFGDWVLALECNSHVGREKGFIEAISRGGAEAINYWWNVNGLSKLQYAANGQVITGFEVSDGGGSSWWGSNPDALDPYLEGLPFVKEGMKRVEGFHFRSYAFLLIERITGGCFDESWLSSPRDAYELHGFAE
ncbi:DUF6461 domain-containing protein [Microtetraspora malaysiensis]|uniref:DUF6461 domain-containing protein n=1 Tax=Microtetraspora malaysiensis TaxID=161358 RepID=A0ABW6T2W7_9ACTN